MVIFSFWAKIKTVITATCDDFCKNFLTRNQDHQFYTGLRGKDGR